MKSPLKIITAPLLVLSLGAFTASTISLWGCASTTVHPGAANQADSQIYDALMSLQASIGQAKLDFGSDPKYKPALNRIIAGYNAAMDTYVSYHKLAASGGSPDPATLQAQVAALVKDIAALQAQAKGGAK